MSQWHFPGLQAACATLSRTHHIKSFRLAQSKLTSNRSGINTAPLSIPVRARDPAGDAALSSLLTRCQQRELPALKDYGHWGHTGKSQDFGYFLKQQPVSVHLKETHEKPLPETWSKVLDNFISFHTAWLVGNSLPFLSDKVYKEKVTGHFFP